MKRRAPSHRLRCRCFGLGVVTAALLCLARTAQLQLVESERWRERALAQSEPTVPVPAARGGIYDREGRPLALDAAQYRAYLAPREVTDRRTAVETIGRILELSARQRGALLRARQGWVPIPRRVSAVQRDRLLQALGRGVHFESLAARVYPEGDVARALLGGVAPDGSGRSGLELVLETALRGEPGEALERRDARGETYRLPGASLAQPRPGHDVWLTIDTELQAIAETALERALRETGASGGDVLILDPRTGELLAVASRRAEGAERVPAFTDPFEPGSTAKPFLLAALLAEGAARLDDRVYAEEGTWRVGTRTIRDVHPHDTLTVEEAIRFSSNIAAAKLAARLEPGQQYRWLRDFGFGTPTGIEYPAESGGLLRRPSSWSGLSQASLAFGYEMLTTSLQLASAYAALANGGVLLRPGLVRQVLRPDGTAVWRHTPEVVRRVIPPALAPEITRVLASAVAPGGTGAGAALATLPVAGKTGTARTASAGGYRERRYVASFVGYTPVEDPRLVILAKLEDPQGAYYGGTTAAPIAREVLQAALAARGLPLRAPRPPPHWRWDRLESEGSLDPFRLVAGPAGEVSGAAGAPPVGAAGSGADRVLLPELRGLAVRAAAARLHELGLAVELEAMGRVEDQSPPPGTALAPGRVVRLR